MSKLKKSKKIYFIDNGIRNAVIEMWQPIDSRTDNKRVLNFAEFKTEANAAMAPKCSDRPRIALTPDFLNQAFLRYSCPRPVAALVTARGAHRSHLLRSGELVMSDEDGSLSRGFAHTSLPAVSCCRNFRYIRRNAKDQPKEQKSPLNRASMIESAHPKFVSSITPVNKLEL